MPTPTLAMGYRASVRPITIPALLSALIRETGRELSRADAERLHSLHAEAYKRIASQVRPLPGAKELLHALAEAGVPHTIATSGRMETARSALEMLGVRPEMPVITRDAIQNSVVAGDNVWDLLATQRARALSAVRVMVGSVTCPGTACATAPTLFSRWQSRARK
jgi:phosphoglycolate phosphatase-like HAD superfamily hydrolase